ncbi:Fe2+ or Zn2+ uptake regulation protein [Natronospira proteinivora]|uniref:Fe2+ or Zn2+ uptake regulation protein n=1 Tax=Natronospira proteinivora TaxID=1807133 RepID=A0ABT1G9K5_9GAMM|nr:transcriptional repressor [Natronospira proteinivora]MCP1727585.1 Fe2+ or Zn2+ uptake regulation protein [Natronospira proteinivora]
MARPSYWTVEVRDRPRSGTQVRLYQAAGYRRYWDGEMARSLCRNCRLRPGAWSVPKRKVHALFLAAARIASQLESQKELPMSQLAIAAEDTESLPDRSREPWRSLAQRLRDHGLIPTRPRLLIAERVYSGPNHFTAEDLFTHLRSGRCRCARATIYNTLSEFAEQKLVQVLYVDNGPAIYDRTTAPHAHVYNMDTGEIRDADPQEFHLTEPRLPEGIMLEDMQIVLRVRDKNKEKGHV